MRHPLAAIERRLALILTEYFCTADEGKRDIFLDYVVGKMSLEQKRAVLLQIGPRKSDNSPHRIHSEFILPARP